MATPLAELLSSLRSDPDLRGSFFETPEAFLDHHGWASLEPAELHEACSILADATPPAEAARWLAGAEAIDNAPSGSTVADAWSAAIDAFDPGGDLELGVDPAALDGHDADQGDDDRDDDADDHAIDRDDDQDDDDRDDDDRDDDMSSIGIDHDLDAGGELDGDGDPDSTDDPFGDDDPFEADDPFDAHGLELPEADPFTGDELDLADGLPEPDTHLPELPDLPDATGEPGPGELGDGWDDFL